MEMKKSDEVERVRRAHLNDLENIPLFLIAALMYVMTEPNVTVALWLIRVAVVARFLHTIVSWHSPEIIQTITDEKFTNPF
jgi:glutathione S-transferase